LFFANTNYVSHFLFISSSDFVGLQDFHIHGFLEVGAAALLVGDMDAKINDQQWKYSVTQEFPDIDLLQPSSSAPSTFASSQSHLKAITASKRMRSAPNQVWYCLLFICIVAAINSASILLCFILAFHGEFVLSFSSIMFSLCSNLCSSGKFCSY